ncbi:MAG: SIR2 family protein [Alphaproteobacteria bacterium]|nr:SIR2 family protein [Alphaproteobacteria bacterium]
MGNDFKKAAEIRKPDEVFNDIVTFLANKSLLPIVGSGISVGLTTAAKKKVPNGEALRNHMLEQLCKNNVLTDKEKDNLQAEKFTEICGYYEDDNFVSHSVRLQYLKNHFYKVDFSDGDIRKKFFDIDWPYIYTLNIDDAIERNTKYTKVIQPFREVLDAIFDEEKCVIKLHGDIAELITYVKASKVFSTKEYAVALKNNAFLLNKLENDCTYQNILFVGCSLDDEIDFLSFQKLPINIKTEYSYKRIFYFSQGVPSALKLSRLRNFGITDVVCFDTYPAMYNYLEKAWQQTQIIQTESVFRYAMTKEFFLSANEVTENQRFFYNESGLYDSVNRVITYPYFFIKRNTTKFIEKNLNQCIIHLLYGPHFSGESYVLADLVRSIHDRPVYYFDGKMRISDGALTKLIQQTNIVALFDIGTVDREQFEVILKKSGEIHTNNNNFVIALHNNDSDTLGIVKWKLKENILRRENIKNYYLLNTFANGDHYTELTEINSKMPLVGLPPYVRGASLLDHLLKACETFEVIGKYVFIPKLFEPFKELIFMIVLGIKEKIYSSEIIGFSLTQEAENACQLYSPYIQKDFVEPFEKSNMDLSSVKYVVNSKYWLHKQLGLFVRDKKQWQMVGEAFQYIVSRLTRTSYGNLYKQRAKTRDYILFDRLNDVFFDKENNAIWLILEIYRYLEQQLNGDFQFNHQYAKGFLRAARKIKDKNQKEQYLKKAEIKALLANSIINAEISIKYNEKLVISESHVLYTLAVINCEVSKLLEYKDANANKKALESLTQAWKTPYNETDFRNALQPKSQSAVKYFINYCVTHVDETNIGDYHREFLDTILEYAWGQ